MCGDLHQIDPARVGDDQLRAVPQPALHLRSEHRVRIRRIGADDHDHVGLFHRIEVLRSGGSAESGLESVAGRRMADTRARVGVVVAERRADHLLHQIRFFVGAARRGDAADGIAAIFGLDALEFAGSVADGFFPGDFAPGIGDLGADHGLENAVLVRRVAPRKAALHAGMAVVRFAVLERNHADHFVALHLRFERTADAAISAGGDDGVFPLAFRDDAFFDQRGRGTRLHAGSAGHAFGIEERFSRPRKLWIRIRDPGWSTRTCLALPRRPARSASTRCTWKARR